MKAEMNLKLMEECYNKQHLLGTCLSHCSHADLEPGTCLLSQSAYMLPVYCITVINRAGITQLVERPTEKPKSDTDAGSSPRCGKGFFSQSQLSVQTLLRCPHSPVCNRIY